MSARLIAAATLALVAAPALAGQEVAGVTDVARDWRLARAPLEADLSAAGLDLSDWERVALTDPWPQHLAPGYDGAVWYRRTIALPAAVADEAVLLLGPSRHGGYRLWADGLPVGAVGADGGLPYPQTRLFELPAAAAADGVVELAIRFHRVGWASDAAGAGAGPFEETALVGSRATLAPRLELARLRARMEDLAPFVLGLLFAGIGLHHLFLHLRRPGERAYLWFGLGALAFGANTVLLTRWLAEPIDDWGLFHRLPDVAGHGALVALLLYLWTVLDRPLERWLRAYFAVHGALVLFLVLAPDRWVHATGALRMTSMIPALVAAPVVLGQGLRKGHPAAGPLMVGVLALVLAELGELARAYGAPLPRGLPVAGFAALLLSMAVVLTERFSRAHRRLGVACRELERRVEQRAAALTDATRAAERAHRARSAFLANMSHELRTPLNAVIGFANVLLRRGAPDGRDRDFLERIHAAGERLLVIINDVLDLSRLEAGTLELALDDVDVANAVRAAVARLEPEAEAKAIYLHVEAPVRLRPVRLDPARLDQVLVALVGNALRFTEHGGVTVRVEAEGDRPRAIVVEDTGVGITPAERERVFEAFQHGSDGADEHPGTGLGLAIARTLCRMMASELSVESERGVGSRFRMSLPVAPLRRAPSPTVVEGPPEGRLVIVIDDEADARLLLEEQLRSLGMRVVCAESGLAGLRLARELKPDLVTLDLKMPGMDGWATLRAFKADPALRDVPVVVVSVIASEAQGTLLGHLDLVGKPVDRDALEEAVRRNLRGRAARALVIDDDPDARLLMRTLLESAVEEVRTADDGRHALEVLESFTPGVILLDLVMPRMDGIAFLHALRQDPRHARTPVLVVTSKELTAAEASLLERATEGVLRKGSPTSTEAPLKERLAAFLAGSAVRN